MNLSLNIFKNYIEKDNITQIILLALKIAFLPRLL